MTRVLLAGGGHTHIELLRRLRAGAPAAGAITLVNPSRWFTYSGMVPGVVAGHYAIEACRVDLATACAAARVTFVEGRVARLDLAARVAVLDDGQRLACDLLSLDVGSSPDASAIAGAETHGLAVRPLGTFVARWQQWLDTAATSNNGEGLVVVGGGAGGAELAMAAAYALRQRHVSLPVTLVSDELIPSHQQLVRRRVSQALRRMGVRLVPRRVTRIDAGTVVCDDGEAIGASLAVYATGAAGPGWVRESGLLTDAAGCVSVEPTLRSRSHPWVFAAGDVATIAGAPLPKAGVFAVRQAPVLTNNLAAAASHGPLEPYTPQRRWLSLVSLGERRAIASYGSWAWEASWVWRWKDVIDRRFVNGG